MSVHFADERALVYAFGTAIETFPSQALSPGATALLIIGHELHLSGAGAGGADGAADILAVDDCGEVWLIEAKLSRNPQSNPWYLFGRQLAGYAEALVQARLAGLHSHLQDYAFGRRTTLQPPASLAANWLNARSLTVMLEHWLHYLGHQHPDAVGLVSIIEARIASGQFVMAALVDNDSDGLCAWADDYRDRFQTAVIVLDEHGIRVPFRTPSMAVATGVNDTLPLPPFNKIPQSFSLRPRSIPLVLNDSALRLWQVIVEPSLEKFLGPLGPIRCEPNATSFGYCVPSRSGPPFFIRIGRGDERVHRGTMSGRPGSHALKVDVVFKWACIELLRMTVAQSTERQSAVDSIYRLCHGLVFRAGYRFKATSHQKSRKDFNREFLRGLSERTLLVERGGLKGGVPDFGASLEAYDEDLASLKCFFEELIKELPTHRPLAVVAKPQRSGDYSEGRLMDCSPSLNLVQ